MRRNGHRLTLLATLVWTCACGSEVPPGTGTPLVDGVHQPLVLTESTVLKMRSGNSGNRFVSGWWPGRRGASPRRINAGDRATLEAVFLDGRERRINTRLDVIDAAEGATIGVRVAGIELPPLPLVPDLEIPLPGGLALGRQPIELDLRGARVVVHAAGFGHAWPAGEIDPGAETIVQAGYSAIDFPRRLGTPATLVGRFEPPAAPEADQRFALLVETDGDDGRVGFEWRAGGRRGGERIEVPLPAGFVRVRLLAQGLGDAGRWQRMELIGGDPAPGDAIELSTAPGRAGTVYMAASRRYRLILSPRLGLAEESAPTRDAEYVFDLRREPAERRNLAGLRRIEIDWLRARLAAWMARDGGT